MASRYWVGGDGTWNSTSTANWSATSGGAAGASAPTTADDAIFDSNSGTGTCTTDGTATCRDTTINNSNFVLSYGANCTFVRTIILTSGAIKFNGNTITAAAFSSVNSNVRSVDFGINGKFVSPVTIAAPWNTSTATNLTILGSGTIDCTYSGSVARSVAFGNLSESQLIDLNVTAGTGTFALAGNVKNVNFTGFAGSLTNGTRTIYGNLTISSGMTAAAGTNVTTFAGTSGTKTITTNDVPLDFPVTFNGIGSTWEFADALTLGSTRAFTFTNGTVKLKNGVTCTVGSFATSGTNQKYLQSTVAGSQATLSDESGTNSLSYTTIKDINATGGATWTAYRNSGNVDNGGNSGFVFSRINPKRNLPFLTLIGV